MLNPDYIRDADTKAEFEEMLDAFERNIFPIAKKRGLTLGEALVVFSTFAVGRAADQLTDAAESLMSGPPADDDEADSWKR